MLPDRRHGREIQPPDGRGRQEGHDEGYYPRRVEFEFGSGRAGYDDGLAEREDDEQAEALGEVLRSHVPGGWREAPPARYPVSHERRAIVERERYQPEHDAFWTVEQGTRYPQHANHHKPDEDASGPLAFDRPAIGGREGQEGVSSYLDRDVRAGKQQRVRLERLRYRHRHQEAHEH